MKIVFFFIVHFFNITTLDCALKGLQLIKQFVIYKGTNTSLMGFPYIIEV